MKRRSIFFSKDDSLFPVDEVFIDYRNYYDKVMELLINESIMLQTDIFLNDKLYIDKIKSRAPNKDINIIQEEILNYENNKIGRFSEITSLYPNNFRSFFLTQIYGFIENELTLICKEHSLKQGIVFPLKEIKKEKKKSILKESEQYIKCFWSDTDTKLSEEFDFIDRVRLIRNAIVHSSGIVNANKKAEIENSWKTPAGILELKEIGKDEFRIRFIGDKLIHDLLDSGKSLFKKILDSNFLSE